MNPKQAFENRTARLLAEGAHKPRVAYTSEAPAREHLMWVEMEDSVYGYRSKAVMPKSEVNGYIAEMEEIGYLFSDLDNASTCWCVKEK